MNRGLPSGRPTAPRGVALLIVITILVTMVLVAVPFALSMRQGQERTEAVAARSRATFEASLLADITKFYLAQTHPDQEEKRRQLGGGGIDANAQVDDLGEITPTDTFRKQVGEEFLEDWAQDPAMAAKAEYLESRGLGPLNDDRGSIWTVQVEDAQARVNVNGASPFLLGNLLGLALLSDDIGPDSTDISVQHVTTGGPSGVRGFPSDGGYIRIGREVISYETFDGEVFQGCARGALQETPLADNGPSVSHDKGLPVIDYTAYKLATHLIARRPGALTPFQNLEALRDIASWGQHGVLTAQRLQGVLPYLTVWSRRETSSGFLAEQQVVNPLPESVDGSEPEQVRLRDPKNPTGTPVYFNAGTIVRFTDSVNTVYQAVSGVGDGDGGQRESFFTAAGRVNAADPEVAFKGGFTRVAALAPYPININTASREVLYAVMANVHLLRADSDDKIVTPKLAWTLAGDIVTARKGKLDVDPETDLRRGGPFRHTEDFGRWLEKKQGQEDDAFSRDQMAALYLNAVNPHSALLRFGTAPWCFRTLDVYHVEARVAVNNRAGEQIAEAAIREVVEIGSDTTTSWVLDSQDDFEERFAMGSGGKWVTTYPYGVAFKNRETHAIQPALRGPKAYINGIYADSARGRGRGDARLEPARLLLKDYVLTTHFDSAAYSEGHYTDWDERYTLKTKDVFMKTGDVRARPFTMSFWWRPYSRQNWTAFDAGIDQFENRYTVFVQDGEQGQELTFRCCAGHRWRQGAEVYVPLEQLDYEPGNWYHIHVSCHGEDPATMQMLVDGVDIGRRRAFTFLSGSIAGDSKEIPVESTDGFPIRGALRIGAEIIEYDTLAEGSFRDCIRGARGTEPDPTEAPGQGIEFPSGTPVHLMGYSLPLLSDVVPGGGALTQPLAKWSVMRVASSGDVIDLEPILPTDTTAGLPPLQVRGFDLASNKEEILVTAEALWGQDPSDAEEAFGPSGLALLGCRNLSTATEYSQYDIPENYCGWEYVTYTREGSDFTLQRDFQVPEEWYQLVPADNQVQPHEEYHLVTEVDSGNGDPIQWAVVLVPISIFADTSGSVGGGYLDPSDPETNVMLRRAHNLADEGDSNLKPATMREYTARVCLARAAEDSEPQQEVILYDAIGQPPEGAGVLFVAYRYTLELASNFGWDVFLADSGGPGPSAPPAPLDPESTDPEEEQAAEPDVFLDEPTGEPDAEEDASEEDGGYGLDELEPREGSAEARPPPEEPVPNESGGGGDYGEGDNDEDAGDSKIPAVPHGKRDPGAPVPTDESFVDPDGALRGLPLWGDAEEFDSDEVRDNLRGMGITYIGRGQNGTEMLRHEGASSGLDGDALFLPCFRVRERREFGAGMGRNDVVTITDGADEAPTRVEVGVRWGDDRSLGDKRTNWVALDKFIDQRIEAPDEDHEQLYALYDDNRGRARVLKFPCGELPDEMSDEIQFGESRISGTGRVRAFLDEVNVWNHPTDPRVLVINPEGISPEADEIRLYIRGYVEDPAELEGYDQDCGVFQLEGELIVYRGLHTEEPHVFVLERCARGQLGTRPVFHPNWAQGRFLPEIPVSYLEAGMTTDAATVPMARTRGWPQEGLARIVREDTVELVHYTRIGERELVMPISLDADERTRDRGLFRGRFGTDATDHDNGEIVFYQPFRYWDRYAPRRSEDKDTFSGVHDHPDASYMELGKKSRSAYWRGFRWQEELLGRGTSGETRDRSDGSSDDLGFLDIVVLARFSPGVPWETSKIVDMREREAYGNRSDLAKRARDHLFVFDHPGDQPIGPTLLNDADDHPGLGNLLGIESDTAEFRVYFVYKPNAFDPLDNAGRTLGLEDIVMRNWWKQTPWLRKFTVNYFSRTMTRYRAPLR